MITVFFCLSLIILTTIADDYNIAFPLDFLEEAGVNTTQSSDKENQVDGFKCRTYGPKCPRHKAYTGECDERNRCLCNDGFVMGEGGCKIAGLRCYENGPRCPRFSVAYTGDCDHQQRCVCSKGFSAMGHECDVPGFVCSPHGIDCPKNDKAYTGKCGDRSRCSCSDGFDARGKECKAAGLLCFNNATDCPAPTDDKAYTGKCDDTMRCVCSEGYTAIDDRCDVPGLACNHTDSDCPIEDKTFTVPGLVCGNGIGCPSDDVAYTGVCDERNSRCTCQAGFVMSGVGCEESLEIEASMPKVSSNENYTVETVTLSLVIGFMQTMFLLAVVLFVIFRKQRHKKQTNNRKTPDVADHDQISAPEPAHQMAGLGPSRPDPIWGTEEFASFSTLEPGSAVDLPSYVASLQSVTATDEQ